MKYQNNKDNMITLGKNGNYTKRGRLDHKQRGSNFSMHSEFQNFAIIAKIQIFAMHSNFRYDSEFSL